MKQAGHMTKFLLLGLSMLFGCTNKADMTLYQAICGGEKVTLQAIVFCISK